MLLSPRRWRWRLRRRGTNVKALVYMLMDHVDTSTLHVGGYWSEVLSCTIMTHLDDLEIKKNNCVEVFGYRF